MYFRPYSVMVNDGTCNGLVYLEGEQVRWLLDLSPIQWSKLEEVVGQSGEINLNMVIHYSIPNKKIKDPFTLLDNYSFFNVFVLTRRP